MDDFRQVTDLDHATSDDTVRLARTHPPLRMPTGQGCAVVDGVVLV